MQSDTTGAAPGHAPARPDAQWACLACGSSGFAVPLDRVSEVVTPQQATRVPGCGPEVCGLIGFRGRVVTVFDLGVLAGGAPSVAGEDHRLVLVDYRGRLLGLAVDAMVTVAAGAASVGSMDEPDGRLEAGDITGTVATEGRTFATLDVDHLLGRLLA